MKKLLMSLALVGTFAAMSAKGEGESYLYWMVDKAEDSSGYLTYNAAELYAVQNGTKFYLGEADPSLITGSAETGFSTGQNIAGVYDPAPTYTFQGLDVSSYANGSYSFMVELYLGEQWVSQSTLTYEEVLAKGGFYKPLMPSGAGAAFTTFSVPEPTSGLLMLFGLCGLALKRKRA